MRPFARPQRDGVSQPARRRRTVHQPAEESVTEGSQGRRLKRAFQGETGYKRTFYRVQVTKGNTPGKTVLPVIVLGEQSGDSGRGRGCTFKWPNWLVCVLVYSMCVLQLLPCHNNKEGGDLWAAATNWQTGLDLIMHVDCWQISFLVSEEERVTALQIQNDRYFSWSKSFSRHSGLILNTDDTRRTFVTLLQTDSMNWCILQLI